MKRALILAAPLALVLGLGACGDDDDSPDDTALPGGTVLPGGTALPGGTVLPGGTIPDLSLPDISIPDLTIPDISIPDITIPENADEFLRDSLGDLGLDDEQIDCLIDQLDLGSGEAPDINEMMDLFDECDINPADLTPGG